MKRLILFVVVSLLFASSLFGQNGKLAIMIRLFSIDSTIEYDPSYVKIKYPLGDIDPKKGVCTDAVIRTYRWYGIDLQEKVHEDMESNFDKYPKVWGKKEPDTNIDHRRVLNLKTFFERKGTVLPITNNPKDYKPGNIVVWELWAGTYHIGIVSDVPTTTDYSKINLKHPDFIYLPEYKNTGIFMIFHNIGNGQILEDCLFNWKIIGHYKFE